MRLVYRKGTEMIKLKKAAELVHVRVENSNGEGATYERKDNKEYDDKRLIDVAAEEEGVVPSDSTKKPTHVGKSQFAISFIPRRHKRTGNGNISIGSSCPIILNFCKHKRQVNKKGSDKQNGFNKIGKKYKKIESQPVISESPGILHGIAEHLLNGHFITRHANHLKKVRIA